jgi:hypothetical protein
MLHEAQALLPPLARSALHGIAAQLRSFRSENAPHQRSATGTEPNSAQTWQKANRLLVRQ